MSLPEALARADAALRKAHEVEIEARRALEGWGQWRMRRIHAEALVLRFELERRGMHELANRAGEILRLAAEARTEVERG